MFNKLIALRRNDFLRHNAVFWTASLGVAALNYLYYPVIGRFLPSASFGEVQTIISILTQLSIFFQVLGLVSVGVITRYPNEQQRDTVMNELSRMTLLLATVLLAVTVLFSPLLKHFFQFSSIAPFFLLAVALLISMAGSFANAFLQGHKRFGLLAIGNVLVAILKIVFAVIFVLIGGKTLGAIGGIIAAQLVGLLYALRIGSGVRHFVSANLHIKRPDLRLLRPELPYAGVVFVSALAANLLLSLDILVVKHYFEPSLAGLYAGISVIANAVFYVSGPFAAVLLPSLQSAGKKADNLRLLLRSVGLTSLVGGGAMAVFLAAPGLIVQLLLGHDFTPYAGYLRGLAVALFIMSLVNLLVYYHLGLRNYLVAPLTAVGVVATLAIIAVRHASLGAIVADLVIGASIALLLLLGLTVRYHASAEVTRV